MGLTIMTEDECTLMIGDNRSRYGWQGLGTKKTAPISLSRQKKHVFGALPDGDLCLMFSDDQNSEAFLAFLKVLHDKYGSVLLFVDNASWHKSAAVRKGLKEFNGEIKLEYYPPYMPELNAVETQWNVLRNAIGSRVYKDTDEMIKSIRKMIKNKEVPHVKMSEFLIL